MTRDQYDNAVYKAHEILDKDGIVTVKFVFNESDRFMAAESFMNKEAAHIPSVSYGNIIISAISKTEDYDAHEALGYVLSELNYIGASKIKSI